MVGRVCVAGSAIRVADVNQATVGGAWAFDLSKVTVSHASAAAVTCSSVSPLVFHRGPRRVREDVRRTLLDILPDIESGEGLISVEELETNLGL